MALVFRGQVQRQGQLEGEGEPNEKNRTDLRVYTSSATGELRGGTGTGRKLALMYAVVRC